MKRIRWVPFFALLFLASCAHPRSTPYESATPEQRSSFKRVMIPLLPGTAFKISQGAFGLNTHHDAGHEYTWDFDVPYGTPVLSVEDGVVFQVWEPDLGGGCDPKYNDGPHNVKIKHLDGTIAQYVHVNSRVRIGQVVAKGEVIAVTAENGFICTPQLDFGIYQDERHLYNSGQMKSIPLLFEGMPDGGMAHEGYSGVAPAFGALHVTAPCPEVEYGRRTAELKNAFDRDQFDRVDFEQWTEARMVDVQKNDRENRTRAADIFAEGCLKSADDYWRAAVLFQHGEVPDHFFQSYLWAMRAFRLGKKGAGTMAANAMDRYLMAEGYRQAYGTQMVTARSGREAELKCFCIWPIDSAFPESRREDLLLPSRSQSFRWLKDLNRGKIECANSTCKVKAKALPPGMVPEVR